MYLNYWRLKDEPFNNALDMALYLGMRERAARVDGRIVERVVADLRRNLPPPQEEAAS